MLDEQGFNKILKGKLCFYSPTKHEFMSRYFVLTKTALLIFGSVDEFKELPDKPLGIVPLAEIAMVNEGQYHAKQLLKKK